MALIAIASDKGAPGVTTAALALAAVWPRPVLLAECDPAGGDLVYRFPAAAGGHLDPRRGVLSLAVMARRGMQPQQVWEHVQKLHGGLDVLAGVTNAEQGAGLSLLWGPIGKALASLSQADVIADCGRLGADGPLYDLLAEATTVVLVSKVHVADVIRLRDRATAFAAAAQSRGRRNFGVGVVVVADHKKFRASLGEVQHVLGQAHAPATVLGGIAHDTKGADLLSGEWGGSLDRTMLIKTARQVAGQLVQGLPPIGTAAPPSPPGPPAPPAPGPPGDRRPTGSQPMSPHFASPQSAGSRSGRHQAGPARADGGSSQAAASNGGRTGHHAANSSGNHAGNHAASQADAYSGAPAANPAQPRIARHAQLPARLDGTRQDGTRQDGTRQDGTRQDSTRQDSTRQDSSPQDSSPQDSARQNGSRSVFTRTPMTPLAPPATEATHATQATAAAAATPAAATAGGQENPEDAGWAPAAPWERPGPSRPGEG
jgi:MinD-like ATPase involved in chromosome partitioning or flagellar assembly